MPKVTDYASLVGVAPGDLLVITDVSDTSMAASGTTKKVAYSELLSGLSLNERYLKPVGSYENFSRSGGCSNQAVLTSGTVALTAIALPDNFTVTSIGFVSGTTAAVTPTHWWFALCDEDYLSLRATANQTSTAWAANTEKLLALSSTFLTTYEGLYYLAVMMAAATPCSMQGAPMSATGSSTPLPFVDVVGITAQTTPPSDGTNLATAPVGKSTNPWGYVI